MIKPPSEWVREDREVVIIGLTGKKRVLKVPIEINQKRKTERVFIDDLAKTEQIQIAMEHGITPTDIHNILMIFVDSRFFEGKSVIKKTYRFNKMLFYLWKELEKTNFKQSYIHDEFGAARAGPVPKNLKPSIRELEKNGFVNVKWSSKPTTGSSIFTLTEKGMGLARELWNNIPDEVKMVYKNVKQNLSLISAEELRHKVHKEYPEYRRFYTELDDEA